MGWDWEEKEEKYINPYFWRFQYVVSSLIAFGSMVRQYNMVVYIVVHVHGEYIVEEAGQLVAARK